MIASGVEREKGWWVRASEQWNRLKQQKLIGSIELDRNEAWYSMGSNAGQHLKMENWKN